MDNRAGLSPKWNTTTKLVVALTIVAVLAGVITQVRGIVGPLMTSFILAYIIYPLAAHLRNWTKCSWRASVSIIYSIIILVFIGLLTWGGLALIEQIQSMAQFLTNVSTNIPTFFEDLQKQPTILLPKGWELLNINWTFVGNQVVSVVQPMLAQLGTLAGTLASGAATVFGWLFFIFLISYFILVEASGLPGDLITIEIPGYSEDIHLLLGKLNETWNAFLRGQLIITTITVTVYTILLGSLGVHYYFGLALLGGLAKFVPYVGPAIAWATFGIVGYFQNTTIFGLSPFAYGLVIVGIIFVTDTLVDNLVSTPLMANALRIHPAAIMVAVLIAANFLGIIGVVLASPVLATIKLFSVYIIRKLFDLDPWEGVDLQPVGQRPPTGIAERILRIFRYVQHRTVMIFKKEV